MNTPDSENDDTPELADRPEALHVEMEDEALDDTSSETVPSGATVRADQDDAVHGHGPDREPTEDEEDAAERSTPQAPDVSDPYEEARTGKLSDIEGEGRILPD